jgi:hypothetical protein
MHDTQSFANLEAGRGLSVVKNPVKAFDGVGWGGCAWRFPGLGRTRQ